MIRIIDGCCETGRPLGRRKNLLAVLRKRWKWDLAMLDLSDVDPPMREERKLQN